MLSIGLKAQLNIANYTFASSAGTYVPLTGATTFVTSWDNDISASIPLGGTFTYGAASYTACFISANGFITFGAAPSGTNYTPLSSGTYSGAISAFGQDANSSTVVGATPSISYENIGGATGEFVVQYTDHSNYYNRTTERLNFQIRLNLASGEINIVYGSWTAPGSSTSGTASQVGIRGSSTVWASNVNSLNTLDIPVGTSCNWANAITSNANSSSMLFATSNTSITPTNGLTFTWAPPVNATLAPVRTFSAVTGITSSGANISWTAPTGATQYNVQYRMPGTCSWTNFAGNPVATNSVSLIGLNSATVYQVRVRSNDGTNNSIWSHIPNAAGTGNGYSAAGTFSTTSPICSGAPTAGTAAASSPSICSATNFTLSLAGSTTGVTGLTYQWQSSPDGISWTSIPTATLANAVTSQTSATFYQAIVTCTASATSATSTPIQVGMNDFLGCYCVTTPGTNNTVDIITKVVLANSLGAVFTQTSSAVAPNFVTYSNTPVDLVQGSTTNTVSITYGTDGTQYGAAWIDFNRNGIYEASENVGLATSSSGGSSTVNYSFTVPMGASLGNTRMRVRGGSDAAYTAAGACNSSSYGETEDYLVNIIVPPTCYAPTALTTTNITNGSVDLTWTTPIMGTPLSYIYEIRTSGAAGSGATGLATTGTVTAPSTSVSVSGLAATTSYSVYIVSDCGAGDMSSWSSSSTFTTLANCPVPTGVTVVTTPTTAVATWTAGGTESAWDVYYGLTPLTAPTASTAPTATSSSTTYTLTSITPSTGYDFYVRANCGGSSSVWTLVNSFTSPCLPPNLLTSNGSTRCGTGTTTLTATADPGATINWYSASTGGASIATGTLFTTPTISTTTDYYAEAGNSSLVNENAGPPSITLNSSTNTNYGSHGISFSTTKNNVTVVSAKLYVVGSGSVTISLRDATDTEISSTTAIAVTGSGSVTPVTVPINLTTTTAGDYYLIMKSATGISSMYVEDSPTYPYISASGSVSVTAGYWYGFDTGSHRYFYDLNFQYTDLCASTRTMVTATVTAPPALTISSPAAICAGSGVATLSVTSTLSDYDSYSWTPTTGLFSDAAATIPYTGTASTVYVSSLNDGILNYNVNANNSVSGCATVASASVAINAAPTSITLTANPNPVCAGTTVSLSAIPNAVPVTVLTENFNGATNTWTTTNNSTGGTAAAAAWSLQTSPYTSNVGTGITSNDASQFYLTDSDAQGSGGTTATILQSPAINTMGLSSLDMNFYHYYNYYTSDVSAKVEVSTDGTSWTSIQDYKTGAVDVGTPAAFASATLNLNAYVNNPTVYVRFNYNSAYGYGWAIDNVKLAGTTLNDYSFAWTSTPVGFTASTSSATDMPAANTTYSVVITNTTTSCSNSSSVAVTVNALPTVTATASSTLVCAGSPATLTAGGATNYTWTSSGTTDTETVTPTALTVYTVTGEDNGCSNTATVSVDVNALPSVTATASNTLICFNLGETSILTASTSATSYTWSDGANTMSTTVSPTVGTTYTVTVNDGTCDATATVFVDAQNCLAVNILAASANGINVYPNPTNGILNIAISTELTGTTSIEVYDAIGKLVIKETLSTETTTINTTKLTDGIYVYKVINNNKAIKIGKVVKQ
jgi:hypothetical protein